MPKAPFETSPQHRPDQSPTFFDAVAAKLDLSTVTPLVAAIEAKLGMQLSVPLLRLGLVAYWLHLEPHEVEDACRERPELARFVASTLGHPVVDLWVYQQLAPRMQAADAQFSALGDAIEDELAARGCSLDLQQYEPVATGSTNPDWAQATIVSSVGAEPWSEKAEGAPLHSADAMQLPVRAAQTRALVLWPWGDATELDRPLAIGRDEAFSPFAARLDGDRWISRRHVVLEPVRGGVMVRDAGSSNGTRADGMRIARGQCRLIDSDCLLQLGPHFGCKIVFYPNVIVG